MKAVSATAEMRLSLTMNGEPSLPLDDVIANIIVECRVELESQQLLESPPSLDYCAGLECEKDSLKKARPIASVSS